LFHKLLYQVYNKQSELLQTRKLISEYNSMKKKRDTIVSHTEEAIRKSYSNISKILYCFHNMDSSDNVNNFENSFISLRKRNEYLRQVISQ